MKREVRIEVRATSSEKEAWRELAKPFSLSEYVRQLIIRDQTRRENGDRPR